MKLMVLALLFQSTRGFVASNRKVLQSTLTSNQRTAFLPSISTTATSTASAAAARGSTSLSHRLSSSKLYSTSAPVDDASAFSKSRLPFSMPRGAADDSKAATTQELAWNALGLWTELVEALTDDLQLERPTAVQQLVIPFLLNDKSNNLTFLSATGSGKTLAYSLPLLQKVKEKEVFIDGESGNERRPRRPSVLVLAPTRELCHQIGSDTVKKLCHKIKLSSTVLTGKEDYGKQRRALNRPIDIVVATPGRFLQHWREQNIHIGSLQYIVLDEMDTMLEQGFAKELKEILYPALYKKKAEQEIDAEKDLVADAPNIIMTSATMTQSIQKMIGDTDVNTGKINARKHYVKRGDGDEQPADKRGLVLPSMPVLKAKGLHKAVPRLQQVFVDVGSSDKLSLMIDILGHGGSGAALRSAASEWAASALTMIFCNTAAACRAVQYALAEASIETLAYHGELNSEARTENLKKFRMAGSDAASTDQPRILVCTDLAARGLDVPQVDHVVMFDFPLNALDYLHRSGRTARGDRTGGRVTALVSKRDRVLANAIEKAVQRGDPLDGLTSRKSDYQPGGRLNTGAAKKNKRPVGQAPPRGRTGRNDRRRR